MPTVPPQTNPVIAMIQEEISPADLEAASMCAESIVDGTQRAYVSVLKHLLLYNQSKGYPKFDLSKRALSNWLIALKNSDSSYYFVRLVKPSVAFLTEILNRDNPFDSKFLERQWRGLMKRTSKQKKIVKKATPLDRRWLTELYAKHVAFCKTVDDIPLVAFRNLVILVLQYYCLARVSDIQWLRACDLSFESMGNGERKLVVFFPLAKNDQFAGGNSSYILEDRHNSFCPVRLIELYMQRTRLIPGCKTSELDYNFLIRCVRRKKVDGEWVQIHGERGIASSLFVQQTKDLLKSVGYTAPFTAISAKAAGVSYAFTHGATKAQIQHQGRWKNEETAALYQRNFGRFKEGAAATFRARAVERFAAEFAGGVQTLPLRNTEGQEELPDIILDQQSQQPLDLVEYIAE